MILHMKSRNMILTAMLTVLPSAMMAQQNIQKAFDALLNEKDIEIKAQHSLDKDPDTGKKEGEMDLYDFVIQSPSSLAKELIKDIELAFEKDKDAAYQYRTVSYPRSDYMSLAVGDGKSQSVAIGKIKGSDYIYACFLDKDDPEKKYRYAYAMEWLEKDKKTQVRLAVTYATTQKYREGNVRSTRRVIVNGNEINVDGQSFSLGSGLPFETVSVFNTDSIFFNRERSSESWLSEFNTYKNLFQKNPDGTAASHYATYIYKLCKNAKSLEDAEKNMVVAEIKKLKAKTADDFIRSLFDMSIERLKK